MGALTKIANMSKREVQSPGKSRVISPALKSLIDAMSLAAVLSDSMEPNCPIAYCNKCSLDLTGHAQAGPSVEIDVWNVAHIMRDDRVMDRTPLNQNGNALQVLVTTTNST